MTLKHTALMLILWLFCQQAGAALAAVAALPFQNDSIPESQIAESCHDSNKVSEQASDSSMASAGHHYSGYHQIAESTDQLSQKCCDFQCQCCIGGCLSMLTSESGQAALALSFPSNASYSSAFPQTLAHSLFRPPISR